MKNSEKLKYNLVDILIKCHLVLIVICLFRVPILALLQLRDYRFFLIALPIISISLMILIRKSVSSVKNLKLFTILFFLGLYTFLYLIWSLLIDVDLFLKASRDLSPIIGSIIYATMLYTFFRIKELENLLYWLMLTITPIAFTLIFIEFIGIQLQYFRVGDVRFWLTEEVYTSPLRISTFMGQGAISGITSVLSFTYFFIKSLTINGNGKKLQWQNLTLCLLSFLTVIFSDSFTLILSCFSIVFLFLVYIFIIKKNEIKIKMSTTNWIVFVIVLIGVCIVFSKTELVDRFLAYFFRGEIYIALRNYFPELMGCRFSSFVFGLPVSSLEGLKPLCNPGEFSGLFMIFKYGFLLQLSWFFLIFWPIINECKRLFKGKFIHLEFFLLLSVIFPYIHYSGIEIWGNNYFAVLLAVLLLKKQINEVKR